MVIAIHNAVNERTWQEILKYEGLHFKDSLSPKPSVFLSNICVYATYTHMYIYIYIRISYIFIFIISFRCSFFF